MKYMVIYNNYRHIDIHKYNIIQHPLLILLFNFLHSLLPIRTKINNRHKIILQTSLQSLLKAINIIKTIIHNKQMYIIIIFNFLKVDIYRSLRVHDAFIFKCIQVFLLSIITIISLRILIKFS